MARVMGEEISTQSLALVRPTMGQAFGLVGRVKLRDHSGSDSADTLRAQMGDAQFDKMMAELNYEFEGRILRGPTDEDLRVLRTDSNFKPEVAIESQMTRVLWELDAERVLTEYPRWRRGRLRDVIAARELAHEWLDMFTRLRIDRVNAGLPAFDPPDDELRSFFAAMPHTQVAVSVKTRYHKNQQHRWTVNDIADIDAVSVAHPYCEAVFPDKAVRAALLNSKELQVIGTFVPRRPEELAEWLDALPTVVAPTSGCPIHLPERPRSGPFGAGRRNLRATLRRD